MTDENPSTFENAAKVGKSAGSVGAAGGEKAGKAAGSLIGWGIGVTAGVVAGLSRQLEPPGNARDPKAGAEQASDGR